MKVTVIRQGHVTLQSSLMRFLDELNFLSRKEL